MKNLFSPRGLAVLALLCLAPCARAITIPPYIKHSFTFIQYGYDQGAYVKGQFDAFDSNGDGLISGLFDYTYNRLEYIVGSMELVGHPTIYLSVPISEGSGSIKGPVFSLSGDGPFIFDGEVYGVNWDNNGFYDLPASFPRLAPTGAMIITRVPVPDHTGTGVTLGLSLLLIAVLGGRARPRIAGLAVFWSRRNLVKKKATARYIAGLAALSIGATTVSAVILTDDYRSISLIENGAEIARSVPSSPFSDFTGSLGAQGVQITQTSSVSPSVIDVKSSFLGYETYGPPRTAEVYSAFSVSFQVIAATAYQLSTYREATDWGVSEIAFYGPGINVSLTAFTPPNVFNYEGILSPGVYTLSVSSFIIVSDIDVTSGLREDSSSGRADASLKLARIPDHGGIWHLAATAFACLAFLKLVAKRMSCVRAH